LRLDGMGAREGYWSGAYLAVFLLLSLSESVLLNHASLPWTLMLAILSRAVIFDAPQKSAALARAPSEAYGNRLRIASDYVNGPARRRPVRLL
jgi:exopolysaccharide production protein ExoQ